MESYMGDGWYPKHGTHSVKLKLQWGNYKGEVVTTLGGNMLGIEIIKGVADCFDDGVLNFLRSVENEKYIEFEEDTSGEGVSEYAYVKKFKLYNGDDILELDNDDDGLIKNIVVGVEITGFEEKE